jgi:rubredoxin
MVPLSVVKISGKLNYYGGGVMEKWQCSICGYTYDPQKGDPEHDVTPGTPFEKLPDDWTCPECGAAKDMFEKVEE